MSFVATYLHTQISPCDHNAIRRFEDGIVIFQSFEIFQFGNDFNATAFITQYLTNGMYITGLTDKRSSNEIDIIGDAPIDNIVNILFRQSRQIDNDTGQIHIFAFPNTGIVFNPTRDFSQCFVRRQYGQDQTTVCGKNKERNVEDERQRE